MSALRTNKKMCPTCPFRPGVAKKYRKVAGAIAVSAVTEAGRICHNTGKDNLFYKDTGKPEQLCRGAKDIQLAFMHGIGFISAPTDAAWDEKCRELNLPTPL